MTRTRHPRVVSFTRRRLNWWQAPSPCVQHTALASRGAHPCHLRRKHKIDEVRDASCEPPTALSMTFLLRRSSVLSMRNSTRYFIWLSFSAPHANQPRPGGSLRYIPPLYSCATLLCKHRTPQIPEFMHGLKRRCATMPTHASTPYLHRRRLRKYFAPGLLERLALAGPKMTCRIPTSGW